MPYLKLFRDEPETEAPAPIPFRSPDRNWREAGEPTQGPQPMDSIAQVEQALGRVENIFEDLSRQADAYCEPIRLSDWIDDDDDGPWAA